MTDPKRKPALARPHPAENLPERPTSASRPAPQQPSKRSAGKDAADPGDKMTEQLNLRVSANFKASLAEAVVASRAADPERQHSMSSIIVDAVTEHIERHNLRR